MQSKLKIGLKGVYLHKNNKKTNTILSNYF